MVAFNVQPDVAFGSFNELLTGVSNRLDRDDLLEDVPRFIALAEDEMFPRLNPQYNEKTVTVMATDGLGAIPSDMGRIVRVSYGTHPRERFLPQNSASMGLEVYTDTEPFAYSLESGGLRLWPPVSANVTVVYQPKLPRLTSTTQVNDLLLEFPSLYFYGALMHACDFISDDVKAERYNSKFEQMMAIAEAYFVEQKWAGPLVPHRVGLR